METIRARFGAFKDLENIEYIVQVPELGIRFATIDNEGRTAIVVEKGNTMNSLEDIQKQLDVYLDECALEWE